jgi:hypothetical protein
MANFQYFEASSNFNIEEQGDNQYGKVFQFENPSTALNDGATLADRFFPERNITIKVTRKLPEQHQTANYDEFHDELDFIIADLQDPDNFKNALRNVRYSSHTVEAVESYMLATINLNIEDQLFF